MTPEIIQEYKDSSPSSRINEALLHLKQLDPLTLAPHQGLLQIGSGNGHETQALRQLYPLSPLLAIDADPRSEVRNAASNNNAAFLHGDITQFAADELDQLIQGGHVKQIVGMRIPAEVVLYLMQTLPHTSFDGKLLVSIVDHKREEDSQRKLAHMIPLRRSVQTFDEGRLKTERGYSVTFPLVSEENVA